jgi:transglutaminase-like putative cysteine protease
MHRRTVILWSAVGAFCSFTSGLESFAQESVAVTDRLGKPYTTKWRIGLEVRAKGDLKHVIANIPIPTVWPEQEVRITSEDHTSQAKPAKYREVDDGAKQLQIIIPKLAAGEMAKSVIFVEVVKRNILPPKETSQLHAPKSPDAKFKKYLQKSPLIEIQNAKIKELAKQFNSSEGGDWKRVEKIFHWVRDNIEYRFDRDLRGAVFAIENGRGDCEEMTSLFIALCRLNGVPARSVWVPGHCYPEFYLEDNKGVGTWFPCQVAGASADFGEMAEIRPILQKGDSFKVPEHKEPQRYLSEYFKAKDAADDPEVRWIREQVLDATPPRSDK